MQAIEGEYEGKQVIILYEGDSKPAHLFVRFVEPIDLVRIDDMFPNVVMLSAQLCCTLGYKDACDLLFKGGIPRHSGLWRLNHDGYPSEHFVRTLLPEHIERYEFE